MCFLLFPLLSLLELTQFTTGNPFIWAPGQSGFDTGLNTFGKFTPYPLTENDAKLSNYKKIFSCSKKSKNSNSRRPKGNFYWKDENFVFLPFYNARTCFFGEWSL